MRDRLKNLSVSFVLLSVLYVLLGLVLLIWPATVMDALCYLTGGILLLYGVISIVGFCREEMRTAGSFLTLLLGIVGCRRRRGAAVPAHPVPEHPDCDPGTVYPH